jgi:hypothetical protein
MMLYACQAASIRALIAYCADGTGVASSTNTISYWNAAGALTNIFTPSAGASIPFLINSRDWAYMIDGIPADRKKWNYLYGLSNWGIAAPITPPNIAVTASGISGAWSASTVSSTFGITVDTNNNVQQLVSVNATGNNTGGVVGTSGPGSPNWNQTPGGTTSDSPITWTNKGPIGIWIQNHFYDEGHYSYGTAANPAIIYDPETQALYFNNQGGGGTSGATYPGFNPTVGAITPDGTVRWEFLGFIQVGTTPAPVTGAWAPSTYYMTWGATNNFQTCAVVEPTSPFAAYNPTTNAFNQPVYLQAATVGGTTPATESGLYWAPTAGQYTDDGQLRWLNMGLKTYPAHTPIVAWTPGSTTFAVIEDTNGNIEVCITGGTTSASAPTFPTPYTAATYGTTTNDSASIVWSIVGPPVAWAASTKWFLPAGGFIPPASTSQYGGVTIVDSSNDIETVVISGKTGATEPSSWAAVGSTTVDGGVTWFAVAVASTTSGAISLVTGRYYYVVFVNSVTGDISDLSPLSAFTGEIKDGGVLLYNIPVSPDSQVDQKIILATADGGDTDTLYFLAEIPNSQTTYSDTTPEPTLLENNVYQYTDSNGVDHGVVGNWQPPANGSYPIVHRGRLFMANGQSLFFSKSLDELVTSTGIIAGRYEEDWPPGNVINISNSAEEIHGLLSDGITLYIGTENSIRRLTGTSASDFSTPDVLFEEVGLLNQQVWQTIFLEGTPVGTMWMTPDFRVLGGDFTTYDNVGRPIQSTLNTINVNAAQNCWAQFASNGTYNFYILAIPTGTNTVPDTLCVFDTQLKKWYVWQCADSFSTGIFYISLFGIPRWIMIDANGIVRQFGPNYVTDRADTTPIGITSTIKTSWLDLGDAGSHKVLNQIELETSDPGLLTTVQGASLASEFITPVNAAVTNAPLVLSLFGDYIVPLAGTLTKNKFFQFTFTSKSSLASLPTDTILGSLTIEIIPINRF